MLASVTLALTVCMVGLTVWIAIDLRKAEKRQKDIERRFYGRRDDDRS